MMLISYFVSRFDPEIRMTKDDFTALTEDGALCNVKGEIGGCYLNSRCI